MFRVVCHARGTEAVYGDHPVGLHDVDERKHDLNLVYDDDKHGHYQSHQCSHWCQSILQTGLYYSHLSAALLISCLTPLSFLVLLLVLPIVSFLPTSIIHLFHFCVCCQSYFVGLSHLIAHECIP